MLSQALQLVACRAILAAGQVLSQALLELVAC